MDSKILVERRKDGSAEDAVTVIELNRPERDNAVDSEMLDQMIALFKQAEASESSRVIVIRGKGANFCAGRDTKEGPATPASFKKALKRITALNRQLRSSKCITVSCVRGKAFGVGFGIALQSDFTLAADDAKFSFPEMTGNLPPAVVLSYVNRWLPVKTAFDLVVSGRQVGAEEAKRLAIVNTVVTGAQLDGECDSFVDLLLKRDAVSLRLCKTFAVETRRMSPDESENYGVASLYEWMSERVKREGGSPAAH